MLYKCSDQYQDGLWHIGFYHSHQTIDEWWFLGEVMVFFPFLCVYQDTIYSLNESFLIGKHFTCSNELFYQTNHATNSTIHNDMISSTMKIPTIVKSTANLLRSFLYYFEFIRTICWHFIDRIEHTIRNPIKCVLSWLAFIHFSKMPINSSLPQVWQNENRRIWPIPMRSLAHRLCQLWCVCSQEWRRWRDR